MKGSTATAIGRFREQEVTVGIVLKAPFGKVEDTIAAVESLFSGRLIYIETELGRLWISRHDPKECGR
jgi:hypothetical protein